MKLINNLQSYGLIAILLHWIMTVLILGLFVLGEYMVDLTYYDPWYIKAPDFHRSFGVVVAFLFIYRLIWRIRNIRPNVEGKQWEKSTALAVHRLFYLLIAIICISGYLITTADGQAVLIFGWFSLPATLYRFNNQEDIAGLIHEWSTHVLLILATLHGLAALKHHFINHDSTLRRMLWPK